MSLSSDLSSHAHLPEADTEAEESIDFVRRMMPLCTERPTRLLDVGCGNGAVAAGLTRCGFSVVAIDDSMESVRRAKAHGLEAYQTNWVSESLPDAARREPYDGVLFIRSLHHLTPIEDSLTRAAHLLRDGGRVLIDDSASDARTEAAAEWVYGVLSLLRDFGIIAADGNEFAYTILRNGGTLAAWNASHAHDGEIAAFGEIAEAVRRVFSVIHEEQAPYLYRYISRVLPTNAQSATLTHRIADLERRAASAGMFELIGRRMVGVRR